MLFSVVQLKTSKQYLVIKASWCCGLNSARIKKHGNSTKLERIIFVSPNVNDAADFTCPLRNDFTVAEPACFKGYIIKTFDNKGAADAFLWELGLNERKKQKAGKRGKAKILASDLKKELKLKKEMVLRLSKSFAPLRKFTVANQMLNDSDIEELDELISTDDESTDNEANNLADGNDAVNVIVVGEAARTNEIIEKEAVDDAFNNDINDDRLNNGRNDAHMADQFDDNFNMSDTVIESGTEAIIPLIGSDEVANGNTVNEGESGAIKQAVVGDYLNDDRNNVRMVDKSVDMFNLHDTVNAIGAEADIPLIGSGEFANGNTVNEGESSAVKQAIVGDRGRNDVRMVDTSVDMFNLHAAVNEGGAIGSGEFAKGESGAVKQGIRTDEIIDNDYFGRNQAADHVHANYLLKEGIESQILVDVIKDDESTEATYLSHTGSEDRFHANMPAIDPDKFTDNKANAIIEENRTTSEIVIHKDAKTAHVNNAAIKCGFMNDGSSNDTNDIVMNDAGIRQVHMGENEEIGLKFKFLIHEIRSCIKMIHNGVYRNKMPEIFKALRLKTLPDNWFDVIVDNPNLFNIKHSDDEDEIIYANKTGSFMSAADQPSLGLDRSYLSMADSPTSNILDDGQKRAIQSQPREHVDSHFGDQVKPINWLNNIGNSPAKQIQLRTNSTGSNDENRDVIYSSSSCQNSVSSDIRKILGPICTNIIDEIPAKGPGIAIPHTQTSNGPTTPQCETLSAFEISDDTSEFYGFPDMKTYSEVDIGFSGIYYFLTDVNKDRVYEMNSGDIILRSQTVRKLKEWQQIFPDVLYDSKFLGKLAEDVFGKVCLSKSCVLGKHGSNRPGLNTQKLNFMRALFAIRTGQDPARMAQFNDKMNKHCQNAKRSSNKLS